MDSTRWERMQSLFHDAADRPTEARTEFLRAACAGDDALFADVTAMLDRDAGRSSLLDRDVADLAGRVIGGGAPRDAGRSAVRSLSPHATPRRRRHGHRLPWCPRRSRQRRRDQDPARRVDVTGASRTLRQRAADPRAVEPSGDRQAVRRRYAAGWNTLAGDGIRRRRAADPTLPRTRHLDRRSSSRVPQRL